MTVYYHQASFLRHTARQLQAEDRSVTKKWALLITTKNSLPIPSNPRFGINAQLSHGMLLCTVLDFIIAIFCYI